MRQKRDDAATADLFSVLNDVEGAVVPSPIRSPLVGETEEWLSTRALTLGNMLASERAVEYVAILRAIVAFRDGHEPEPLHEDVERKVCGEDADTYAESAFKSDIRQLRLRSTAQDFTL